jgi:hypothetical protein
VKHSKWHGSCTVELEEEEVDDDDDDDDDDEEEDLYGKENL